MRQAAEFIVFLLISTASHLALYQGNSSGAAEPLGDTGDEAITLVAGTEALSEMVAKWDRPVDAVQKIQMPQPATSLVPLDQPLEAFPYTASPPRPNVPAMALALPAAESLPTIDTTVPPPSALAKTSSIRPQERPSTSKKKTQRTVTKQAKPSRRQVAAGSGQRKASGTTGKASTSKTKKAANPALMAKWGNSIRAAVERRKRYPKNSRARGKVVLSVAVASNGALASVKVRRSSGDAALDQAALAAVKRARFKAAPSGLKSGVHHFSLPISFKP